MDKAYVTLQGVSVGYNGVPLIHDINVEIEKGEILALIGPNGAGKSTILKSISKQLSLLSGKVSYAGRSLEDFSSSDLAREIAVLLTEHITAEQMTCFDVAAMGRYPYTGHFGILTEEDRKKVDQALFTVNASDIAGRSFATVSDGQKQRVLLAGALCQEPEVLLLDEPTSYLDVRYKLELLSILRRLARERKLTVILSLHEIDLAQKTADKILCVRGETIFRYGTPEEIFDEALIRDLYDLDNGSYDPAFGSVEFAAPQGSPRVFVLSRGDGGIPWYRKLQRENIPFVAGILCPGEADERLASRLAVRVIREEPYREIGKEAIAKAVKALEECTVLLDTGVVTGQGNARIRELLDVAGKQGKYRAVTAASRQGTPPL